MAVMAAGMMFSSCGNIDIVKRKHRPGFHVDITKNHNKKQDATEHRTADARDVENNTVETKHPEFNSVEQDVPVMEANAGNAVTDITPAPKQRTKQSLKETMKSDTYRNMSFERKLKTISNEVMKPSKSPSAANLEWMKWVSFGTGIGALAFGAFALLFSILVVTILATSLAWPFISLALLLSAAAITFSVIYKKNNGTGSQARLGMIFGIIGGGLAVLAIILWAILFTVVVL